MKPDPRWLKFCEDHPCPICGADPARFSTQAVEEIKMWNQGLPTHNGDIWESEIECLNGHITRLDPQAKFYDKPVPLQ